MERVGAEGFVEVVDAVTLDVFDEEARLPPAAGGYVLEVFATWPQGDGDFSFGLSITEG